MRSHERGCKVITYCKRQIKNLNVFYKQQRMPEDKVFWCIVPVFCITGLICSMISICQFLEAPAIISTFFCAIFPVFIMLRCRKTKETQRCYKVFCLIENCALIPIAFVMNGGMHSGMPLYCLGGTVLGVFCVTRKDRLITVMAAIGITANLFADSILYPQVISKMDIGIVEEDILLGFLFVAIGMIIITNSLLSGQIERGYREINNGIIEILGSAIEFRSAETGNHIKNIRELMRILLESANEVVEGHSYLEEEIKIISSAAMLHDIGKIIIPDVILNKPGKLTEEEFEIIKSHPIEGCRIIEEMKEMQGTEYFCYSYEICRHHHEAYDGSGYPDGLKGDEIPFVSQLASLADVYEALSSKRAYKSPCSAEEVHRIITEECKGRFSEDVFKCYRYARGKMDLTVRNVEK